ncbi:MAG: hypothetical protein IH822_04230 [Chloroflexi bacterium]|nr:hypothetical protein [Chloroflexota bacterium]
MDYRTVVAGAIRYRWWAGGFIGAILVTITFSAEFGWDNISDDWRGFFKEWAIDWVPAFATFVVALIVLQQVRLARRGQQFEYAPVIRLDLEVADKGYKPVSMPANNLYADPFEDEGLDWRRESGADPQYLMLTIRNQQSLAAGSAQDVEIEITLKLPIEPFDFTLRVGHVEPSAKEKHAVVDLGGLNWSSIEIATVDFWDDSDNHYTKAHGLGLLERDRDGNVVSVYTIVGSDYG